MKINLHPWWEPHQSPLSFLSFQQEDNQEVVSQHWLSPHFAPRQAAHELHPLSVLPLVC